MPWSPLRWVPIAALRPTVPYTTLPYRAHLQTLQLAPILLGLRGGLMPDGTSSASPGPPAAPARRGARRGAAGGRRCTGLGGGARGVVRLARGCGDMLAALCCEQAAKPLLNLGDARLMVWRSARRFRAWGM